MSIFAKPIPFDQAIDSHAVRTLLGSTLDSKAWRKLIDELPDEIRQRVFFSSEVFNYDILDSFFAGVGKTVNRQIGDRDPRTFIREQLADLGYDPEHTAGTIKDLTSFSRLKVMLDTNLDIAYGFGQFAQQQAVVDEWPALELFRAEDRDKPRGSPDYRGDAAIGWESRWEQAAGAAGDTDALACLKDSGRMVALKDSAIWDHLGNDWEDSLGNPFPPFAWGSGMDVEQVGREEAIALGLMDADTEVEPREIPDFNATLQKPITDKDAELFDALQKALGPDYVFKGGVLSER